MRTAVLVLLVLIAIAAGFLYSGGHWEHTLAPVLREIHPALTTDTPDTDKAAATSAQATLPAGSQPPSATAGLQQAAPEPDPEPEPSPEVVIEARQHIDRITLQANASTIPVERADHFVTASQLIRMPAPQVISEAQLEQVNQSGEVRTFALDTGLVAKPSSAIRITLPEGNQIKLQELLDVPNPDSKLVYYIHAVREGDEQGLWGILQAGLTRTFSEGIKLGDRKETLYATIPRLADEKIDGVHSSFLGRLLQDKVLTTYVYNYRSGYLGENPDLILPGQQLIIVSFSEHELVRVYNHFVNL